MSEGRNISEDRQRTRDVIAGTRPRITGKKNWLGHKSKNGTIALDDLLLDGATQQQLEATREAVSNHIGHLRDYHGLQVVTEHGIWRINRNELGEASGDGIHNIGAVVVFRPEMDTSGRQPPERRRIEVNRIVRDTAASLFVKETHEYRCQVCGTRLETPKDFYAEGAHIRPLGSPHDGLDVPENMLCLCPNHHVLFDAGAFSVRDDMSLVGLEGKLRLSPAHAVSAEHLAYHRQHFGYEAPAAPAKKPRAKKGGHGK